MGHIQNTLNAEDEAKEAVLGAKVEESLFKLSALEVNRISKKRLFSEMSDPFEPQISVKRVCNVHISAHKSESNLFKFSKGVKTRACNPELYEIYEPQSLFNITTRSLFYRKPETD